MQDNNIEQIINQHTSEISQIRESVKIAHKRIGELGELTAGIHRLAENIAGISSEIRLLTKRVDENIDRIEQGQKEQGERLQSIEKTLSVMARNEQSTEKTFEDHEKRLDEIEKEPATKWKNLAWLIIAGVVTALVAYLMARLI